MAVTCASPLGGNYRNRDPRTAAIILTGGLARRLASALPPTGGKAACLVQGIPLFTRVLRAVAPVASNVFAVGGVLPPAAVLEQMPSLVHVPDSQPGSGPLAGLRDGLVAIHEWCHEAGHDLPPCVLLLACDLPWLSPNILHELRSRLPDNQLNTQWVIPAVMDQPQYLCSVLRPALLKSLEAFLATSRRDLRGFAKRLAQADTHRVVMISASDWQQSDPAGAAAADIDTPGDLEKAQ